MRQGTRPEARESAEVLRALVALPLSALVALLGCEAPTPGGLDGGVSSMDGGGDPPDVTDGGPRADGAPPELDGAPLDGAVPGADGSMPSDGGADAGPPGCSPAACDDGVACTEDACSEDGRCVHLLLESACARGQFCDLTRGCVDGAVCATDADCADGDPCTTGERCDMSFPRRCTHRVLDADGDRETTAACGGGDCDDTSAGFAEMAHQVCGSAVDADCDGIVALDDLLGTTACATEVFVGGLAACPSDGWDVASGGLEYPALEPRPSDLDVTLCSDPLAAVQALARCQSRATCDASQACSVSVSSDGATVVDGVRVSFTDCSAAFRASCGCLPGSTACRATVHSLCDESCTISALGMTLPCVASSVSGSSPTFDVCRGLDADPAHCGACDNACFSGEECIRGTCCAPTDADCDGERATACETDLLTSSSHCGACGNPCPMGASCVDGACVCPTGQAVCGASCADISRDSLNCGRCGRACGAGAECLEGSCLDCVSDDPPFSFPVGCAEDPVSGRWCGASLRDGLGGAAGFGEPGQCLPNSDNASVVVDLSTAFPDGIEFGGALRRSVRLHSDGSVFFDRAAAWGGTDLESLFEPVIAGFYADVDTREVACSEGTRCANPVDGGIWFDLVPGQAVFTWDGVGYFRCAVDRRMRFQIILSRPPACPSGSSAADFVIEFRYEACQWDTGAASAGVGGLALPTSPTQSCARDADCVSPIRVCDSCEGRCYDGIPAEAGVVSGAGEGVLLPGSRTHAVTRSLCHGSNLSPPEPGVWRFVVRSGLVTCPAPGEECAPPVACVL